MQGGPPRCVAQHRARRNADGRLRPSEVSPRATPRCYKPGRTGGPNWSQDCSGVLQPGSVPSLSLLLKGPISLPIASTKNGHQFLYAI